MVVDSKQQQLLLVINALADSCCLTKHVYGHLRTGDRAALARAATFHRSVSRSRAWYVERLGYEQGLCELVGAMQC